MSNVGGFDVYKKLSNFFELELVVGKVFEVSEQDRQASDGSTVFFEGKHYSSHQLGRSSALMSPRLEIIKRMITKQFSHKLTSTGYHSRGRMGNYHAYSLTDEIQHPQTDVFRLYGGFEYRFPIVQGRVLFVVNPHLIFESAANISKLASLGCSLEGLQDFSVFYKGYFGVDGYLVETRRKQPGVSTELECTVNDYRENTELVLSADKVYPEAKPEVFQYILSLMKRKFDIVGLQRRYSFLDSKTAAKDRYSQTIDIVAKLRERVFPIAYDEFRVQLLTNPVPVRL